MDNKELYQQVVERAKILIDKDAKAKQSIILFQNQERCRNMFANNHCYYVTGINSTLEIVAGLTNQPHEPLQPMYNP